MLVASKEPQKQQNPPIQIQTQSEDCEKKCQFLPQTARVTSTPKESPRTLPQIQMVQVFHKFFAPTCSPSLTEALKQDRAKQAQTCLEQALHT